jgi:hypothetical protein
MLLQVLEADGHIFAGIAECGEGIEFASVAWFLVGPCNVACVVFERTVSTRILNLGQWAALMLETDDDLRHCETEV